jgi:hypothetical protein
MNMLFELAFSLLFYPAVLQGLGLDKPLADGEPACSCSPCTCKEKCACPNCKCSPCKAQKPPSSSAAINQGPRVGITFVTAAGSCPATVAVCPAARTSKVYEVQVRLTGDVLGCVQECCLCPKIYLPEGGKGMIHLGLHDKDGKSCCMRKMCIQLGKVEGDRFPVQVSIAQPSGCGPMTDQLSGKQAVHLDTITGLVLSGNQPEPCCAEVMVSAVKSLPPVVHMPPCCPAVSAAKVIRSVELPRPSCPSMSAPLAPPVCQPAPPPPPVPCPPPVAMTPPMNVWGARISNQPMPVCPGYQTYGPCIGPSCPTWLPPPIPEPMPVPPPGLLVTGAPLPPVMRAMSAAAAGRRAQDDHHSHVVVVHESGRSKLAMSKDDECSRFVRMTMATPEAGILQLAAGHKYVHVSGMMWKACADDVELCPDGRIILTGHVKVVSDKAGVSSSLKANHVCLRVHDGKIKKVDGGMFSKR